MGTLTDSIQYVRKTAELVGDLRKKGRFDCVARAFQEVFHKMPHHPLLETVVPRGTRFPPSFLGPKRDQSENDFCKPNPSPVVILQNGHCVGEYVFPAVYCETVDPMLRCRPLLLQLSRAFLEGKEYTAGVSLLEQVFYAARDSVDKGCEDPREIFITHTPLFRGNEDGSFTCFDRRRLDPELVLFYLQFLFLSSDRNRTIFLLTQLPRGIDYEPDFLILAAILMNFMVPAVISMDRRMHFPATQTTSTFPRFRRRFVTTV